MQQQLDESHTQFAAPRNVDLKVKSVDGNAASGMATPARKFGEVSRNLIDRTPVSSLSRNNGRTKFSTPLAHTRHRAPQLDVYIDHSPPSLASLHFNSKKADESKSIGGDVMGERCVFNDEAEKQEVAVDIIEPIDLATRWETEEMQEQFFLDRLKWAEEEWEGELSQWPDFVEPSPKQQSGTYFMEESEEEIEEDEDCDFDVDEYCSKIKCMPSLCRLPSTGTLCADNSF